MVSRRPTVPVVATLVAAVLATGCAGAAEYAGFAQAGTTYAAALDRLLVAAGTTGVDATSERLLMNDRIANLDLPSYQSLSRIDEERLATIGRLRAHGRLLARYFRTLNDLATSDAPERAQQAAGNLATGLDALGTQLRGSPLGVASGPFGDLARLTVDLLSRAALRAELEQRKDLLQRELQTQEVLLTRLATAIKHDLGLTKDAREHRLVITPLIAPAAIAKPSEWVEHRRTVLTAVTTLDELTQAGSTARDLRQAFEDLVSGKLTLARLNALLVDLNSLLTIADALTPERGSQP